MEVWVKLCVEGHDEVYLLMKYEGYTLCADGSVSNWLEIGFSLKGWKITAVGVMTDYIEIDIE